MANHTQIEMGKPAIQLDNSRVSRGHNNDQVARCTSRSLTPKIGEIEKQYP